jgi:hypothetical protein
LNDGGETIKFSKLQQKIPDKHRSCSTYKVELIIHFTYLVTKLLKEINNLIKWIPSSDKSGVTLTPYLGGDLGGLR